MDQAVQDAIDEAGADPQQGPQKHSEAQKRPSPPAVSESTTPPPPWVDGVAVRRYSESGGKAAGLVDRARDLLTGAPL